MVTRSDIMRLRDAREKAKSDEEQKHREEMQRYQEECLQRDMASAVRLLNGKLGDTIKEFDVKGITCFRTNGRTTEIRKGLGFSWHNDFSPITFVPDPEYAPTKELCKQLREGGFDIKLSTVREQNTKMEFHGDGEYDVVDVPGTHPVHWLEISW